MYINYTVSTNTMYTQLYILKNVFEEDADINYLDIGAAVYIQQKPGKVQPT